MNIEQFGEDERNTRHLKQIVGNWGKFEMAGGEPLGQPATAEFRYRNARQVTFEAHELQLEKFLADVERHLATVEFEHDWAPDLVEDIGHYLMSTNQAEYVGQCAARWDVELDPPPDHFDRRVTVTPPLKSAGMYLLTGRIAGGNTTHAVIRITDTAIVTRPADDAMHVYVADSVTGAGIPDARLELLRWGRDPDDKRIVTARFTAETDDSGRATLAAAEVRVDPGASQTPRLESEEFSGILTARTAGGRFAALGLEDCWSRGWTDDDVLEDEWDDSAAPRIDFAATDRPVYRPGDRVKFKLWIHRPRHDGPEVPESAHRTFDVRIRSPRGEAVFDRRIRADEYGGIDGEWSVPEGAPLGRYSVQVLRRNVPAATFRVEEYRKPEFEVSIAAPGRPVKPDAPFVATVQARYYFGAPVADAKVHCRVLRTGHALAWLPPGRWDWLYGSGYWCRSPNYDWYPGWSGWGRWLTLGSYRWGTGRTDVVLDEEFDIGPDGTVEIEIDPSLAEDLDRFPAHRYEILAEVTDRSRRMVRGRGEVLVTAEPFEVFCWVDQGYYRTGDTVRADFQAQTLDGRPVEREGQLRLFRITWRDEAPVETEVEAWDLSTDARGAGSLKIKAAEAGQYRLSCSVTDREGHTIEGGALFQVIGEGFDGTGYRYNDLELLVERREYRPGETLRLLINTNRPDSTVLLYVRPEGDFMPAYPPPEVIRLDGKTAVHEIEIVPNDAPNFFIEACTISDGRIHTELVEIHVPPEDRLVDVTVLPGAEEYRPGDEARLTLRLTGPDGRPFSGSTALTVYDKSLEAIAPSNVGDIRVLFWGRQREHVGEGASNLSVRRYFLAGDDGEDWMGLIGIFGRLLFPADETERRNQEERDDGSSGMGAFGMGMGGMGLGGMGMGGMGMGGMGSDGDFGGAPAGRRVGFTPALSQSDKPARPGPRRAAAGVPEFLDAAVRSRFADAAFWSANVMADEDGVAEVSFRLPENLTTWKVRAWTLGGGGRVGQGEAEFVTTKNLLVRVQVPRFFVESDEAVLSANVHNYLDQAKAALVTLDLDGDALVPLNGLERSVQVEPNGEARIDWRVRAARSGEAVVRVTALTDEESDAVESRFPVHVHGMLKTESFTGVLPPGQEAASILFTVPDQRRIDESRFELRFSPTLAGVMVDALPYLADYPYGCTEQTLNRFLPTVITLTSLERMGQDLEELREKRINLNPQELGDPRDRAARWRKRDRNPVFDRQQVDRMAWEGAKRLAEMQVADGGWGWFSGRGERSGPHTTAVVVHGLRLATENGVDVDPAVLKRGVDWLKRWQAQQVQLLSEAERRDAENGADEDQERPHKSHADSLDALVFMILAEAGEADDAMLEYLDRDRTRLPVSALALYGLALHARGDGPRLAMVLRNLEQYVVNHDENQTAYLRLPREGWSYWHGCPIETNARYLKLLAKAEPRGETAGRLVKYLVNNRRHATYWNSTRDTASVIEALAEFLDATGEGRPDMTVEVWYDGEKHKEVRIDAANRLAFDNQWSVLGDALPAGVRQVEVRRRGAGPLYYNAWLTNFTLEDVITSAGLEVRIRRRISRLPNDGRAADGIEPHEREKGPGLVSFQSGDLVEVELEIDSRNDYEYVVVEDRKAAGFEPVEFRSGYTRGAGRAYMELRDDRVTFFFRTLARGKHSVRYRMRAEAPGRFSALPATVAGMYAPELRGNSDEWKLSIADGEKEAADKK